MKTKVRTTPEEVAKYREIRAIIGDAENARDNAYNELRAAYEAGNRPMTCNPANDAPEKVAAFFAPKSGAISTAEYRYISALASWRRMCQIVGGARVLRRLHNLERAGVLD